MNQANVELREFNTVLTATQNALNKSAMVSVTDLEGKILKVNQQVCEVSQYSQEELIGQPCAIFNSGFHDDKFWNIIRILYHIKKYLILNFLCSR